MNDNYDPAWDYAAPYRAAQEARALLDEAIAMMAATEQASAKVDQALSDKLAKARALLLFDPAPCRYRSR